MDIFCAKFSQIFCWESCGFILYNTDIKDPNCWDHDVIIRTHEKNLWPLILLSFLYLSQFCHLVSFPSASMATGQWPWECCITEVAIRFLSLVCVSASWWEGSSCFSPNSPDNSVFCSVVGDWALTCTTQALKVDIFVPMELITQSELPSLMLVRSMGKL